MERSQTKQESHTAQTIVGSIFGLVEIALAFRLIFKLLGANPNNGFVNAVYAVTQFIANLFDNIFSKATTPGLETQSVFEPGILIAMVVIGVIAFIILKLMTPRPGTKVERTEYRESGPMTDTRQENRTDTLSENKTDNNSSNTNQQ